MNSTQTTSTAHTALLSAGLAGTLLSSIWIAGLLTPSVYVHGAASMLIVGALGIAVLKLTEKGTSLRAALLLTMATSLVVLLAIGAGLSQPKEVNENVITATRRAPAATSEGAGSTGERTTPAQNLLVGEGTFESLAHTTSGKAQVIKAADGSYKLTLTGFTTDPGPDLRVIAVKGNPQSDGDVQDFIDLGRLKGSSGNQQYSLPASYNPSIHSTIYIWCRAFTVGFGRATIA